MINELKNNFRISEWSGAVGDLGTLLPMAFALVVFLDFPLQRLFLLWGLVNIFSGLFYKVPVAVQPLKAMAAIALAAGLPSDLIATSAFFFGIILILLSLTGLIRWLDQWFSNALVRGIQAGVGLILAQKAFVLLFEKKIFLTGTSSSPVVKLCVFLGVILILWLFQFRKREHIPVIIYLLLAGIGVALVSGVPLYREIADRALIVKTLPNLSLLLNGLVILIIPQLPLTLGNAIFSASNICHTLWKDRSQKVSPTRLGYTIGVSNTIIGLLGGFPICHGSGGIAAHAKFGGRTGGTTIIIGLFLIVIALVSPLSGILFYVPIPVLSGMLFFTSLKMVCLIKKMDSKYETIVAIIVASVSLATRNFFIAMICGLFVEHTILYWQRMKQYRDESNGKSIKGSKKLRA